MDIEFNRIDDALLNDDERIAKYLKGKMTADEEREFLLEVKNNPELKEKALSMARLVKGMKEVGKANDETIMNEFLVASTEDVRSLAKEMTVAKNRKKILRRTVTMLSAAASFALLIWAGIGYYDYRNTTGLGEKYATEFTSSQLTRGMGDNMEVEKILIQLFDNVESKTDLDNTLPKLALCWDLATQETYNDYTDYAPEIGWYLAIGYLKDNDKKNAQDVLKKLIDITQPGTAIGDKARELLEKVEEL